MTNMSSQSLWLSHFNGILLVLNEIMVRSFSYQAHFRPQISFNVYLCMEHAILRLCMECGLVSVWLTLSYVLMATSDHGVRIIPALDSNP